MNGIHEVRGSIPLGSTRLNQHHRVDSLASTQNYFATESRLITPHGGALLDLVVALKGKMAASTSHAARLSSMQIPVRPFARQQ